MFIRAQRGRAIADYIRRQNWEYHRACTRPLRLILPPPSLVYFYNLVHYVHYPASTYNIIARHGYHAGGRPAKPPVSAPRSISRAAMAVAFWRVA